MFVLQLSVLSTLDIVLIKENILPRKLTQEVFQVTNDLSVKTKLVTLVKYYYVILWECLDTKTCMKNGNAWDKKRDLTSMQKLQSFILLLCSMCVYIVPQCINLALKTQSLT